jgi:thioesterase domain-containing protein
VELVTLIDSWSPVVADEGELPPLDEAQLLAGFAGDLARTHGREPDVSVEQLAPLSSEARMELLLERARSVGLVPPGVGAAGLRAFVQVFRAHSEAIRQYRPTGSYSGRLALIRPESGERMGGWDSVTQRPPELLLMPGDHHSMIAEPHVRVLAEHLRRLLEPEQLEKAI